MRAALGSVALTSATPEGRVLLNAAWVEIQIKARRLPIPVLTPEVEARLP